MSTRITQAQFVSLGARAKRLIQLEGQSLKASKHLLLFAINLQQIWFITSRWWKLSTFENA